MKKLIPFSSILILLFSSCSEQENESHPQNKTEDKALEDLMDVENRESHLESITKPYLGEYICCPNEKGRDEIKIDCDNTKPSKYILTIEDNKLVLTFIFWQDAFSNIIESYTINVDTLILNYTLDGKPAVFKVSELNNYLYDNTSNIESNGWIRNPEENGWTVDGCDEEDI